jgi:hypothetical protein
MHEALIHIKKYKCMCDKKNESIKELMLVIKMIDKK